jgi:hypothetical protein
MGEGGKLKTSNMKCYTVTVTLEFESYEVMTHESKVVENAITQINGVLKDANLETSPKLQYDSAKIVEVRKY